MDQETFEKKLDDLIVTLALSLKSRALEIYRSGAIDKDSKQWNEDSNLLQRIILCAAMPDVLDLILMPSLMTAEQRKEIKNLEHF